MEEATITLISYKTVIGAILLMLFLIVIIKCIVQNHQENKRLKLILSTWNLPPNTYVIDVNSHGEYWPKYYYDYKWYTFSSSEYSRCPKFYSRESALRYVTLIDYLCSQDDEEAKKAMPRKYFLNNLRIEI